MPDITIAIEHTSGHAQLCARVDGMLTGLASRQEDDRWDVRWSNGIVTHFDSCATTESVARDRLAEIAAGYVERGYLAQPSKLPSARKRVEDEQAAERANAAERDRLIALAAAVGLGGVFVSGKFGKLTVTAPTLAVLLEAYAAKES